MTEIRPAQVLLEICNLVDSEIAAGAISLPGCSLLQEELRAVVPSDRRDFLQRYICDSMTALLLGVLDQARCMALALDTPGVAVGPFMLMRGLTEYSYKIAYIADPCISPTERICRSLTLYSTDMRQLEKMSSAKDTGSVESNAESERELANRWYKELTGEKLNTISAESIIESVWEAGVEGVKREDLGQNEIYEIAYRPASAVVYGHPWAIRLLCIENRSVAKGGLSMPMLILAARVLQSSVAFFVQIGGTSPAGIKNRLERRIHELETLLAAYQPN